MCTWLRAIGLGEHCQAFLRNHIDGEALRELVEDDATLKCEVGIASFGHRCVTPSLVWTCLCMYVHGADT